MTGGWGTPKANPKRTRLVPHQHDETCLPLCMKHLVPQYGTATTEENTDDR